MYTWVCAATLIEFFRSASLLGSPEGRGTQQTPRARRAGPAPHQGREGGSFTQNAARQLAPRPCPAAHPSWALRPRRPSADLKVPLSSRCSGGASARCLLWDMAKRDGWPQQSREVRIWVLPLHVGQFPRGACPRCCLDSPQIAACLPPAKGQEEREEEAGPRRGRAGHTPSLPSPLPRPSLPCSAPRCSCSALP